MDRFRLFRSRAFWFGVPGLVGLLWGWWVSMGHWSNAGFGGTSPWEIGQGGSNVYAAWGSAGLPDWGQFYGGHVKVPLGYPKASLDAWSMYWPNSGFVLIPYHWLIICYLAVWAAVLVWRKWKYELEQVE